jgi:hypothetical protein
MEVMEDDGSAIQVVLLRRAIKESLLRKGLHRAKREVNEQIVGGDAVGIFKTGKHNATYVSCKSTGSTPNPNSPRTLFPLLQWLGGDDFHNLQRHGSAGVLLKRWNGRLKKVECGPHTAFQLRRRCNKSAYSDDDDDAMDLCGSGPLHSDLTQDQECTK